MTEQYAIYITAAIIASMPVIGAYIVIDTNKRMAKRIAKRTAQALLEEAEYASEHFSSAEEEEEYWTCPTRHEEGNGLTPHIA